jgi:hypothetical protein
MPMSPDEMLSEAEIKKLQHRYCRSCDRADFELMRSCFHPDATTDYGYFGGDLDQFIASAREQIPTFLITTHNTGNQLVEVNGDSAWAEHYTVATHRIAADESGPLRDLVTAVRYIDRLERRDGEWKILKRSLALDWVRVDPVGDLGTEPQVTRGRQGREDLSYAEV